MKLSHPFQTLLVLLATSFMAAFAMADEQNSGTEEVSWLNLFVAEAETAAQHQPSGDTTLTSETVIGEKRSAAASLPFTINQLDANEIVTVDQSGNSEKTGKLHQAPARPATSVTQLGEESSDTVAIGGPASGSTLALAEFAGEIAAIGIPDQLQIGQAAANAYSRFNQRADSRTAQLPELQSYERKLTTVTYAMPAPAQLPAADDQQLMVALAVEPAGDVQAATSVNKQISSAQPEITNSNNIDPLEQMLAQIRNADTVSEPQVNTAQARTVAFDEDHPVIANIQTRLQSQSSAMASNEEQADSPAAQSVSYSRQLLGIYFDQQEHPAMIVLHDGNEYLLPLVSVLTAAGASLDTEDSDLDAAEVAINTPGGPARLQQADFQLVDGQVLVSESALEDNLKIDVRFDQAAYALFLTLPWSMDAPSAYMAFSMPDPDFEPPSASIRNLRADVNFFSDDSRQGLYGDYFVSGNLAGGGWRFRAEQLTNGDTVPTDYFWSKDFGNSQTLFGNSDYSLHPLLPTVEQTGAQFLYSTEALPIRNNVDLSRSDSSAELTTESGIFLAQRSLVL
jgi:hypothetical protein